MLKLEVRVPWMESQSVYFNPYTLKLTNDKRKYTTLIPLKIHSKSPKVLKIMLGDACNFHCKYCRQDHHGKKESINYSHLDNFIQMLQDNLDLTKLEKVEYWGGEPLLYWDEIEYLIDQLEDYFNREGNNRLTEVRLIHHITTNGSLLTPEIVKKIKSHSFLFKLSHDGPGQELRTQDPLKLHCDLIMDLHQFMKDRPDSHFYINSVMTSLCPSPKKIVEWFKTEFNDEDINIMKIEPVIPYNKEALQYAIQLTEMEQFSQTMYEDFLHGDIIKNVMEYQGLLGMFNQLYRDPNYVYNMTEAKCHVNQVMTICTDLNGNITPCQVYDEYTPDNIIGHLTRMDEIKESLPYAPISRKQCIECPVISLCRGVCPHIAPGEYADTNCIIRYHTYWGILRALIQKTTGIKVLCVDELNTNTIKSTAVHCGVAPQMWDTVVECHRPDTVSCSSDEEQNQLNVKIEQDEPTFDASSLEEAKVKMKDICDEVWQKHVDIDNVKYSQGSSTLKEQPDDKN